MIHIGSVLEVRVRVISEPCWGRVPFYVQTVIIGHPVRELQMVIILVAPETASVKGLYIQNEKLHYFEKNN